MNQFFYGRCSIRPKISMDASTGESTVIFSTNRRPAGTKVEQPEEGVLGRNMATHEPPLHVTLYLVPGGTGEHDNADPVDDWTLAHTEDAVARGILEPVATGYLTKEYAMRTSNSEGDKTIERRFAIDTVLRKDKPINEQGIGRLLNQATLTLAVLATQADMLPDETGKSTRKTKASLVLVKNQPDLFTGAPAEAAPAELGSVGGPSEDLAPSASGYNVESFPPAGDPPIDHDHVGDGGAEVVTMADRASSARKVAPKFVLLAGREEERLDARIERSITESGCLRVRSVLLAQQLGMTLGVLKKALEDSDLIGMNPNGTVFSKLDAAFSAAAPVAEDSEDAASA